MHNKVLVVAVHPDDETLSCGGTLLKHKANGDEIYWLIITSIKDFPVKGKFNEEVVNKRKSTINAVELLYDFKKTIELGFPTTLLQEVPFSDLISKIDAVINDVKPNVIYSMFNNDVHSDHRITFEALYSCTKSFRKPFIERIYMGETLSETEFALALPSTSFIPNVFIDISDYLDKKIEIMTQYDTELMPDPFPRSLNSIKALARIRGSRCGVKYAEAFMLLYEKK